MNILMLTNTFTPHVGGVARSVQSFAREFRERGHRVVVAAPLFRGTPDLEEDVIRVPAVQHFNGSEFSLPVPEPLRLLRKLRKFRPDVVHSHHPFLLGGTALRVAAARNLPLIFTHHTNYERYTHYVPGNSPKLKRFVLDLVTGYCNLCDAVIAPSHTVAQRLRDRGVHTPIEVIPTGVDNSSFNADDGLLLRAQLGIPADAFVVGHTGRLSPEKNLDFLAHAVTRFLLQMPYAFALIVGAGPAAATMQAIFQQSGIEHRVRMTGMLQQPALANAYRAMDVFAFASHTETQGLVLVEAMAAGVPVVAVNASGVTDLVRDGQNGRLLRRDDTDSFANALTWVAKQPAEQRSLLRASAQATALKLDMHLTAGKAIALYQSLNSGPRLQREQGASMWEIACRRLQSEWGLVRNLVSAARDSIRPRAVWEINASHLCTDGTGEEEDVMHPPLQVETNALMEPQTSLSPPPSLKVRILGWLWASVLRLQCATWRKEYDGLEELDRLVADGRKILFGFWHGKYVPLFALLRGRPCCVFTSQSERGAIIAEICRHFGYACVLVPVRGRGHPLDLMRRALAQHQNGGIAVDGPLGPYHKVRRGAIKLASELGYVIVPGSVCVQRRRIVKHRWDRMELPKLFSRVAFAIGQPMEIPSNLNAETTQAWAVRLHDALTALDRRAAAMVGESHVES